MESISNKTLIEKFVNKELSSEEKEILAQRLKQDQAFAEEFEIAVYLNAQFRADKTALYQDWIAEEQEEQKKAFAQSIIETKTIKGSNKNPEISKTKGDFKNAPFKVLRRIAAVLAFFALPYLVYINLPKTDAKTLVDKELKIIHPHHTIRSEKPGEVKSAMEYYKEGDYKKAIEMSLEEELKIPLQDKYFYRGLSYLYKAAPDYKKAILSFDAHLNLEGVKVNDPEAKWYKALALIKLERNKEAKQLLEEVLKSSWQNKHKVAKELSEGL